MSIIRKVQRTTYTVVDNAALRDVRLSWRATGLLAYLLSLPDGWSVNIADLTRRKQDGRDATRAAMIELEEVGYVERRTENDPTTGQILKVTLVYEEPVGMTLELTDSPTLDSPTSGKPSLGSTKGGSTQGSKNQEPKSAAAAARPTDRQIYLAASIAGGWEAVGTKRGRITIAALQKLNTRYGVEVVSGALAELQGFPPAEAVRSAYAYVEAICKERAA